MGYFVLGTMSVLGVLTAFSPSLVGADSGTTTTGKWTGVCVGTAGTVASDVATLQGIQCLLANLLGAVLTLFAFVGFFMFIWASFKLMVSNGQPEKFTKAKDTMTYAIFGFILALSLLELIVSWRFNLEGKQLLRVQLAQPRNNCKKMLTRKC